MHTRNQFGQLLKAYRRRCIDPEQGKPLTQAKLAECLEQVAGVNYTTATISNWELGKRQIHHDDRAVLVSLIKIFHDCGSIRTLAEANAFLEAGNYRSLAVGEQRQIEATWGEMYPRPANDAKSHELVALPLDAVPMPGPLPPCSRLLLSPNPFFVGREQTLRRLARLLSSGDAVPTVAITGLGGMGKTQLAVEFSHRYGRCFPGGVFWLNCADPDSLGTEVAACSGADSLALHSIELPLDERVKLVQRAWREPIPRLLVFDNCRDSELLAQWRPITGGCYVLVTSRCGYWDPALAVKTLSLSVLPRRASLALLRKFLPAVADEVANALAAELGDFPLALHLAGRFLAKYRCAVMPGDYLVQLRAGDLLSHPSLTGRGGKHTPTAHEGHVGRTFNLSYKQLDPGQEGDRLAQQLLARAACLAPSEPIPRDFLLATLQQTSTDIDAALLAEDGLARLIELGLLEERASGILWLHRLVADFARGLDGEREAQTAVETVLIVTLSRQMGERGYLYLGPVCLLGPHLQAVAHAVQSRTDIRAADLCRLLGVYLKDVGDYAAALSCLERALTIREQVQGDTHPETARNLNEVGWVLYRLGDLSQAQLYLERALTIQEQVAGVDHLDTAESLYNLGWVRWKQGDLVSARPLLERAQAIREHHLGPDHPCTADSLNALAGLLWAHGDYARAQPLLEHALAIYERRLGLDHPDTAHCLNNLGLLLTKRGDYARSQMCLERALAIREQVLGPDHPSVAYSLNNLATLLQTQGDYVGARSHLERALAIQVQKMGADHPHTAYTLNSLGMLLYDAGDLSRAQTYLEQALAIREQKLGLNHPDTINSRRSLDLLLQLQGKKITTCTTVASGATSSAGCHIHQEVKPGSQQP